ncbi:iron-only hydrogenase system regulator [candidate division WOR-3 bacterium]|nr:iron-only hydrogenase system regulator [candidate division WOR-3 bacterium]
MNESDAVREHRLGVVAVFVENRLDTAPRVNQILSEYARILVGRMGIPYRERSLSVISVIVDGSNDEIGAMTGKLGAIPGVSVKAALRKKNGSDAAVEARGEKLEAGAQNEDAT